MQVWVSRGTSEHNSFNEWAKLYKLNFVKYPMAFKINMSDSTGKTFNLEAEATGLLDKKLGDVITGNEISEDLEGFEFEITGASDKSGFPSMKNIEGFQRKRALLTYGPGMHKRPKREGKKKQSNSTPKGLRLRKLVRGNTISEEMRQINLKVVKAGKKTLTEVYAPVPAEETPAAE